jgi:hypothetical protein
MAIKTDSSETPPLGYTTPHLETLRQHFNGREAICIVDPMTDDAAHLCWLAPHLPVRQHWTLGCADRPRMMLMMGALAEWSDSARMEGGCVVLEKGGMDIHVQLVRADVRIMQPFWEAKPDLFTSRAAFGALTDRQLGWVSRMAARTRAACHGAMLPPVTVEWAHPHAEDAAILALYHEKRDEKRPAVLARHFQARGYTTHTADGEHVMDDARNKALVGTLAASARTTVPALILADWIAARETGPGARIGYRDFLALP